MMTAKLRSTRCPSHLWLWRPVSCPSTCPPGSTVLPQVHCQTLVHHSAVVCCRVLLVCFTSIPNINTSFCLLFLHVKVRWLFLVWSDGCSLFSQVNVPCLLHFPFIPNISTSFFLFILPYEGEMDVPCLVRWMFLVWSGGCSLFAPPPLHSRHQCLMLLFYSPKWRSDHAPD